MSSTRGWLLAAVVSLSACGPPSGRPDLSGEVDLRTSAGAEKELLTPTERRAEPAPGSHCAKVLPLLPQVLERMKSQVAPDPVLDSVDRCLTSLGRGAEQVVFYQAIIEAHPQVASYQQRLANAYVSLGDSSEALNSLGSILRQSPDHAPALFLMGLVYASLAADDPTALGQAVRAWRKLVAVDPDFQGQGGVTMTQIKRQLGRWSQKLDAAP